MRLNWPTSITPDSHIDKNPPLITQQVPTKPPNSWMTPEIMAAKDHRRYLERIWHRNLIPLNRSRFSRQIRLCSRMMSKAKSSYYDGIIQENSADQWSMWHAFNKIRYQTRAKCILKCPSIKRLGTMFGSFFVDKITQIHESFPDVPPPIGNYS